MFYYYYFFAFFVRLGYPTKIIATDGCHVKDPFVQGIGSSVARAHIFRSHDRGSIPTGGVF